jgi:hypothetical protein
MRKMIVLIALLIVALPVMAWANGSAVDQFSAVKYIRNLSDLACQYRDHGLSLQLDGYNYEWLIFKDSCIRQNIEAELVVLGRSREHIIDPLSWQLHVDMLNATIEQVNTITDELLTYNFCMNTDKLISKIAKKANEGTELLSSLEDELGRGEERNYDDLAVYGQHLWMIGNDLICLVKDLDFDNMVALYSGDLDAGNCCDNKVPLCKACWDTCNPCGNGCPTITSGVQCGKECPDKTCGKHKKCGKCNTGCKEEKGCKTCKSCK